MPKRHGPLITPLKQYGAAFGFDDYYTSGKRIRIRKLSKRDAQKAHTDLSVLIANGRRDLVGIDAAELAQFRAWKSARGSSRPLQEVADEFLALKKHTATHTATGKDLARITESLGAERPIADISTPDLQRFVNAQSDHVRQRRRFNLRALVVALWSYAYRQGYTVGPETAAHRIEKIERQPAPPRILTPEEMERLICLVANFSPKNGNEKHNKIRDYLPWLLIGAFAGIRSQEIAPPTRSRKSPLLWEDFKWERGIIYVRRETAKTGRQKRPQPRPVPIEPNLMRWLAPYRNCKGRVCPKEPTKHRTRELARMMGWKEWPANCLRKSRISYWVAREEDRGRVAYWAGNSVAMINNVYEESVNREDAARYDAIMPVEAENIIAISSVK